MRVIHSGHLNVNSGGPALSAWLTIKGLRQSGVTSDIIMPPIREGDRLIEDEANPIYYNPTKFGSLAYVPALGKTLASIGTPDLYHIQGVWMLHALSVARYALRYHIPYVVTLRGMLYPQALEKRKIIKKISMWAYEGYILRNAAAIQCTCIEEMRHYRRLGFRNPVAVIPNPIEIPAFEHNVADAKNRFRIGYLGRLHPRKRVERLIYAMDNLKDMLPARAQLLIIGGGDKQYESFLQAEATRLGLSNIRFAGFLTGKEKEEAIDSLSVLVVPSDFENFGNIVTEALAHGVPVAASTGTPWQVLPERNCGWWMPNDQASIEQVILDASKKSTEYLQSMGENGRELMKSEYSVETLGQKMKELYQWILGQGTKPEFVYE